MTPNISGWILLDKPYGLSSTQAGNIVRRLTGAKKAGHAGTLDPLATGVLPIALGEATKTIPYVVEDVKQYRFQVTWGEQRTTDDLEGEICATSPNLPTPEEIQAALPAYIGKIQQKPPIYSAIKIDGKRAYALARAGQNPDLKSRPVLIHDFVLESMDSPTQATFLVTCGPGTYVRSLARDLALTLGTVGYVSSLRRVFVGKFHEDKTISLETLREIGQYSELQRVILPLGAVLDDIPAVPVTAEETVLIRRGQHIPAQENQTNKTVVLWCGNEVVAIAQHRDGFIYPKRVINY